MAGAPAGGTGGGSASRRVVGGAGGAISGRRHATGPVRRPPLPNPRSVGGR
ncbi:hypothetical protein FHS87_000531 [Roseomonas pecuniae]|uniref:Uncharacterized protein n=1 Tax=Muricoccus pecuniae TaxID=693023 RepID=A0A840XXA4_9PROT|nr:hypothetical protein [Roseomonas pecuniae]